MGEACGVFRSSPRAPSSENRPSEASATAARIAAARRDRRPRKPAFPEDIRNACTNSFNRVVARDVGARDQTHIAKIGMMLRPLDEAGGAGPGENLAPRVARGTGHGT